MPTNSSPISRSHAINFRRIHSPVDVLCTTVLTAALVVHTVAAAVAVADTVAAAAVMVAVASPA